MKRWIPFVLAGALLASVPGHFALSALTLPGKQAASLLRGHWIARMIDSFDRPTLEIPSDLRDSVSSKKAEKAPKILGAYNRLLLPPNHPLSD